MTDAIEFLRNFPMGEVRDGQVYPNEQFLTALLKLRDAAMGGSIAAAPVARSFYQAAQPSVGMREGDFWYDTDDSQRRTYRYTSGAWVHITDKTAYNTAAAITSQSTLATLEPPSYAGNAAAIAAGLVGGQSFIDSSDSNKLKTVVATGTLTVTLNRYAQNKTRSGAGDVTSDAYTATVTGGSGSYEYAWTQYYGDTLTDISAPDASSTTFTHTLGIGETKNAKIRLDVRDTTNNTNVTVLCTFRGTETT